MEHTVRHEVAGSGGAFYIEADDGRRVAAMTYSRTNPTLVIVDHTEVDPSLGGQGLGRRLLDELVAWARGSNTKVIATCPFVKAQFAKDPSLRDVMN